MIAVLILSGLVVGGLILGLFATANAPVGYQDEAGFHYGPEEVTSEKPAPAAVPARVPEPKLA
jgi:hypothetical protein